MNVEEFGSQSEVFFTAITSLVLALIGTYVCIGYLKGRAGQFVRKEGPRSHKKKAGTPTMGGIAIMAASMAAASLYMREDPYYIPITLVFLLFGIMGFMDDYLKVAHRDNLGLKAWQKLVAQILVATGAAVYMYIVGNPAHEVLIPFTRQTVCLGWFYIPFEIFVIVAMTNAVNLTDGLDGLAASVSAMVAFFFYYVAQVSGNNIITVYGIALAMACMGFLFFNRNPAKIFMGDTGSLALGGALSMFAICMRMEFYLIIVGLVYVAEALSVIIQVGVYKKTGKRVFKMAPLHHHFELSGMSEKKVVGLFFMVSSILCVVCALVVERFSLFV